MGGGEKLQFPGKGSIFISWAAMTSYHRLGAETMELCFLKTGYLSLGLLSWFAEFILTGFFFYFFF